MLMKSSVCGKYYFYCSYDNDFDEHYDVIMKMIIIIILIIIIMVVLISTYDL
jgi:hypothetical protein